MPTSSLPSGYSDDNLGNGSSLGGSIPLKTHLGFLGLMLVLLGCIFWPSVVRLWLKTNPLSSTADPNWSHAILVPIIGLYYLYINREELAKRAIRPQIPIRYSKHQMLSAGIVLACGLGIWGINAGVLGTVFGTYIGQGLIILGCLALVLNWGLAFTLWGLAVYALSIYPIQNDYLKDIGLVSTLFGVVLALYGWAVMRIAWFPILFLFCAIPWSGLMYSWLASPLQVLAARVASGVLQVTGVAATVSGTNISMMGRDGHTSSLNVEEACSGLKSLMTFMTIGGALAFLSNRPLWQRLTITFSAIPIAIACNTMRVAVQGLLDYYVSHELSQNFAHQFVGLIMLVPAFFLLLGVGWLLDRVFIDEVDEKELAGKLAGVTQLGSALSAPPSLRAATRTATPAKATLTAAATNVVSPTSKPTAPAAKPATPAEPKPVSPAANTPLTPPGPGRAIPVPPSRRSQVAQNRKPPQPGSQQ